MQVGRIQAPLRVYVAGALTGEAGGPLGKQPRACQAGSLSWGPWGAMEGLSRRACSDWCFRKHT